MILVLELAPFLHLEVVYDILYPVDAPHELHEQFPVQLVPHGPVQGHVPVERVDVDTAGFGGVQIPLESVPQTFGERSIPQRRPLLFWTHPVQTHGEPLYLSCVLHSVRR